VTTVDELLDFDPDEDAPDDDAPDDDAPDDDAHWSSWLQSGAA
jgi:hypothetical protein